MENILPLVQNAGLIALALMFFGTQSRFPEAGEPAWMQGVTGLMFGFGAMLCMLLPVEIRPGVIIDARHAVIALTAPFCGPVAALIATGMAMGTRLWIGGAGAVPGAAGLAITLLTSLAFARWVQPRGAGYDMLQLVWLGLIFHANVLPVFMFPLKVALATLEEMFLPLIVVNMICVTLFGRYLNINLRRAVRETRLRREAGTDSLTGLSTRRDFELRGGEKFVQAHLTGRPLSLAVFDLDHFKTVNDTYGHAVGDAVLITFSALLTRRVRSNDLVGRYGGEEIVVLLEGAGREDALKIVNRIRLDFARHMFDGGTRHFHVTTSAGVASMTGSNANDFGELFRNADKALYKAKAQGRNRVVAAPDAGRGSRGRGAAAQSGEAPRPPGPAAVAAGRNG
ncbi:diguanylate cyclase [Paroceanicella profunda]|uniref:diguanylate cyclase n=1 Tax=Paroceanicella profunda TaxID=2579971 RepID=A0A5B8FI56_9RHOB|nr:diguanylate cyclase [Paroceanicella profunda]QDL93341.1 diguanylate cyclase [Paroceanicella profunda]